MTNDFDPNDPDDLRLLLHTLEADESQVAPQRARRRAEILAAFDADVAGTEPGDASDADGAATLLELPTLRTDTTHGRRGGSGASRHRFTVWFAATLIVIAIGAVAILPESRSQTSTEPPIEDRLSYEGSGLPAELAPGAQTTNIFGSQLSFVAPDGLLLQEEADGRILLGGAGWSDIDGRIVIAELDVVDLEAELRSLADDDRISVKTLRATIPGGTVSRWDIAVTNAELDRASCQAGQPCIALPGGSDDEAVSLVGGADNRITEIGRSGGGVVVVIEQSLSYGGPISQTATEILATLELDNP